MDLLPPLMVSMTLYNSARLHTTSTKITEAFSSSSPRRPVACCSQLCGFNVFFEKRTDTEVSFSWAFVVLSVNPPQEQKLLSVIQVYFLFYCCFLFFVYSYPVALWTGQMGLVVALRQPKLEQSCGLGIWKRGRRLREKGEGPEGRTPGPTRFI